MLSQLWKFAEGILTKSSESPENSEFFVDVEEDFKIVSEETVFCKNNICVHTTTESDRHIPGYLCIEAKVPNIGQRRLLLTWTPNSLFQKSGSPPEPTDGNYESGDKHNEPPQNFDDKKTILTAIFKIDLTSMKVVKFFFAADDDTCGQLVIGNQENHFKVFHFHHGGLNHLVGIFENWQSCSLETVDESLNGRKKSFIISGGLSVSEDCHPEEGRYKAISLERWNTFVDDKGQIEDVANLRKEIFFGGLQKDVRPKAWKFLLCYYPFNSTYEERKIMKAEKKQKYHQINSQRYNMTESEQQSFWRNIQCTVEKDVVRTDRSNPYYAGKDNPNIQVMKNILLNYAYYHPEYGYNQGMSDLVAPILSTVKDESDAFWCFVGLMEASVFVTSPKDEVIEKHLLYLRELLHQFNTRFYVHVLMKDDAMDMLFCHRWLLLCFKREFCEEEALLMWEACWSRYQTEYFHIFICVAMIEEYGNLAIEKNMRVDEMLQYFGNLSMQMDGELILRKARKLLHRFRKLPTVPCSLRNLLSGPGIWDSATLPDVECKCKGICLNLLPGKQLGEERPMLERCGHSSFEIISDKEFESVRITTPDESAEPVVNTAPDEVSPSNAIGDIDSSPEVISTLNGESERPEISQISTKPISTAANGSVKPLSIELDVLESTDDESNVTGSKVSEETFNVPFNPKESETSSPLENDRGNIKYDEQHEVQSEECSLQEPDDQSIHTSEISSEEKHEKKTVNTIVSSSPELLSSYTCQLETEDRNLNTGKDTEQLGNTEHYERIGLSYNNVETSGCDESGSQKSLEIPDEDIKSSFVSAKDITSNDDWLNIVSFD